MSRIALIASVARNGAIGKGNDLLWREPLDLQHFRRTTLGCPVVMGRRTWESLPARFRPLPGRTNIVVTRNPAWQADGAQAAPSLDAALALVREAPKVFVIGGGELYAAAMPLADELVLTEVDAVFDADTFFPPYADRFVEVAREAHRDASGVRFAFVTYRRTA
jgi:dihydrofolate reductase